jgi:hypothetical protein
MLWVIILGLIFAPATVWSSGAVFSDWDASLVHTFFKRSPVEVLLGHMEYIHSTRNLLFLAINDYDVGMYGVSLCSKAQLFLQGIQAEIPKRLALCQPVGDKKSVQYELACLSRHARHICYLSCMVQLKVLEQRELGTIWAESTFYTCWPWVRVDAQTFYDRCCTDFYRKMTAPELKVLMDATKQ